MLQSNNECIPNNRTPFHEWYFLSKIYFLKGNLSPIPILTAKWRDFFGEKKAAHLQSVSEWLSIRNSAHVQSPINIQKSTESLSFLPWVLKHLGKEVGSMNPSLTSENYWIQTSNIFWNQIKALTKCIHEKKQQLKLNSCHPPESIISDQLHNSKDSETWKRNSKFNDIH